MILKKEGVKKIVAVCMLEQKCNTHKAEYQLDKL